METESSRFYTSRRKGALCACGAGESGQLGLNCRVGRDVLERVRLPMLGDAQVAQGWP